jgi:peptide/nickel transport system permease protein
MYPASDTVRKDLAQAFASDARAVGVDAELEGLGWEAIEPRMGGDALVLGGGTPFDPDLVSYQPIVDPHAHGVTLGPVVEPAGLAAGLMTVGASSRNRAILGLVGRRLAFAVPVLVIVSAAMFALGAASPFDPIYQYYGIGVFTASGADIARVRAQLGLDDSVVVQFGRWAGDLLTGDLGDSRSLRQPVAEVIAERLPWTLLLVSVGLGIAVLVALVLGVVTAWRQGGWLDRVVTALAQAIEGIPAFVLALVAIALFALGLGWLPVAGLTDSGADASAGQVARHLVLPATVLGISQAPWLLLHVRQSLLGALAEDHVTGARARGLAEPAVVLRHALPDRAAAVRHAARRPGAGAGDRGGAGGGGVLLAGGGGCDRAGRARGRLPAAGDADPVRHRGRAARLAAGRRRSGAARPEGGHRWLRRC